MPQLPDGTAENRAEMVCPDCWEQGLVKDEAFASRYDDPDRELTHATKCPHDDCDTGRVPPADIESQFATGDGLFGEDGLFGSLPLPNPKNMSRKTAAAVIALGVTVVLYGVLPVALGPVFGTGAADSTPTPTPESSNTTASETEISSPADFYVAYQSDGAVVTDGNRYVTDDGGVSEDPVYYESTESARTTYTSFLEANGISTDDSGSDGGGSDGGPSSSDDGTTSDDDPNDADTTVGTTETGETTGVLRGTVFNRDTSPISGATVSIDGEDISDETDSDGQYLLTDIPEGSHTVVADTASGSTVVDFEINSDGEALIDGDPDNTLFTTETGDVLQDNQLNLIESRTETILVSGTGSELTTPISFNDADNADDVTVRLEPERTNGTASRTVSTADSGAIDRASTRVELPSDISTTQSLALASVVTSERVNVSGTARGLETLSLPGNRQPTNMTLTISGATGSQRENVTTSVAPNTTNTTLPVAVDGDLPTNVTVTIEPTTNTTARSATGTLAAGVGARVVRLAGNDAPGQLTATVRGVEHLTPHNQSSTGDATLPISYRGNQPAVGANGTGQPTLTITGAGETVAGTSQKSATVTGTEPISLNLSNGRILDSPNVSVMVEGQEEIGTNRSAIITSNTTVSIAGNTAPTGPINGTKPVVTAVGATEQSRRTTAASGLKNSSEITFNITGTPTQSNTTITLTGKTTTRNKSINRSVNRSTSIPLQNNGTTAGEASVTITGREQVTTETVAGAYSPGKGAAAADFGMAPRNESVKITPVTTKRDRNTSDVYTGITPLIGVDGYEPPSNETLTIIGNQTTDRTNTTDVWNGSDKRADIKGNLQPENGEITLTGITNKTDFNVSNTTTVTVGGTKVPENTTFTYIGEYRTNPYTDSGTLGGSNSINLNLDGTLPPSGESLQITGDATGSEYKSQKIAGAQIDQGRPSPESDSGSGPAAPADGYYLVSADYNTKSDFLKSGGSASVSISGGASASGIDKSGTLRSVVHLDAGQSPSGSASVSGGTAYDYSRGEYIWANVNNMRIQRVARVQMNGNTKYLTDGESWSPNVDWSTGSNSESLTTDGRVEWSVSATERWGQKDLSVAVDGTTIIDESGVLNDGEVIKATAPLDRGTNTIDISASNNPETLHYWTNWTQVIETKDPAVDIDNDGGNEMTHTGYLSEGETVSQPVTLSQGERIVDVESTGPVEYNISYDARYGQTDPTVDIDNDDVPELQHAGILADGETITRAVNLSTGTSVIDMSTSNGGDLEYQLNYTEHIAPRDIRVDTDGDTEWDINRTGQTTDPFTQSVDLSAGSTSVDMAANGRFDYQITYDNVTLPRNVSATYAGPNVTSTVFSEPTMRAGGEETFIIPNVSSGSTMLNLTADTGAVRANVTLTERSQTEGIDLGVNGEQRTISETLPAGEQTTINISNSSLAAGENTVSVGGLLNSGTAPNETVDLNVTWTDTVGVEAPHLTVNNDSVGTNTTLYANDTRTFNMNLSAGSTPITLDTAGGAAPRWELRYRPVNQTADPTVDTDGDGTPEASYNGTLGASQTTNLSVSMPNATTDTISASSNHAPANVTIRYDVVGATHNITVTDENGSTVAHRNRPLPSGENMTVDVPITSNRTLGVTADGNSNYTSTLAYQTRNATESVEIETTGDDAPEVDTDAISPGSATTYTVPVNGSNATITAGGPVAYELNYSATSATEDVALTAGNTTRMLNGTVMSDRTVTLTNVSPGTDDLRVEAARGGLDLAATWIDRNGTVDPTITHAATGNVLCSVGGTLTGEQSCYIPDGTFTTMTPTLNVSTAAGPVAYELSMNGRAVATDATVSVNGRTVSYPETFSGTGELPTTFGSAPAQSISAASGGSNTVGVSTQPVDGIDTAATARLGYEGATQWTKAPNITVISAAGETNTRSLPYSALDNGKLRSPYTVNLSPDWFTDGTNTVIVETEDGTEVTAELEATTTVDQDATFD